MDPEERLRRALAASGGDLWDLLDAALSVAAHDSAAELRARRDAIVERLYAGHCSNCAAPPPRAAAQPSPEAEEEEADVDAVDDEEELAGGAGMESKILAIKDFLEDPDQSEDSLVSLLQNLADMDITYKALKETDIGRHVNGLRKHPSGEVRRLVKQLVRKWKELVDDWVRLHNAAGDGGLSPAIITDGDSPQKIQGKNHQNTQVPELKYSPSPQRHNGSNSERNNNNNNSGIESTMEGKRKASPRIDATTYHNNKPSSSSHHSTPSSAPPACLLQRMMREQREQKDALFDPEKLDSARRRLQVNYQEAHNAKKQRTIQVMDIQDIPKPKNAFIRKGGGGGGLPARHR